MLSKEHKGNIKAMHEQQLRAIDDLPRLSSEEEQQFIKFCVNGQIIYPNQLQPEIFRTSVNIPEVFEVTGMPDNRKTSLAMTTFDKLTQAGINVELVEEQKPSFNKLVALYHYNMAMFHNTSEKLIQHFSASVLNRPSLILDRGVWGQIAFLDAFRKKKRIELDDFTYETASRYIALHSGFFVDALIICKSSPELVHKPESEWLTIEFLSLLEQAYDKLPHTITKFQKEFHTKATAPFNNPPPLAIVELNTDDGWDTYSDQFIRSFGSIYNLFVSYGFDSSNQKG